MDDSTKSLKSNAVQMVLCWLFDIKGGEKEAFKFLKQHKVDKISGEFG